MPGVSPKASVTLRAVAPLMEASHGERRPLAALGCQVQLGFEGIHQLCFSFTWSAQFHTIPCRDIAITLTDSHFCIIQEKRPGKLQPASLRVVYNGKRIYPITWCNNLWPHVSLATGSRISTANHPADAMVIQIYSYICPAKLYRL